jgi:protein NirF
LRGTGDLGLIIERASGHVTLINTSARQPYARIGGLGDLSHASAVYSRDGRYAFIFGRDGGLTKIDLLEARIVKRVMQSGNAIGGSISQDGRIVVAQNYTPGGIKAFDAETLELLSEVPAEYAPGQFSKVVGLADVRAGNKFAYALFDGGEIWVSDFSNPKAAENPALPGRQAALRRAGDAGRPLFPGRPVRRGRRRHARPLAAGKGRPQDSRKLRPRSGKAAGVQDAAPARLVCGAGQGLPAGDRPPRSAGRRCRHLEGSRPHPRARPAGLRDGAARRPPDLGQFRLPGQRQGRRHRHAGRQVVHRMEPGKGILHMEFAPRGENVWLSARDDNKVVIYNTDSFAKLGEIPADSPSGIFFTSRAVRIGF